MRASIQAQEERVMFIALFFVLLLLWAGGFLVFHVSAGLIHLLLLFAIVSLFFHLFRGRGRTA
jgi:bacteriorhodopsin